MSLSWHLAQLRPNCAQIALRNLARQGLTVFNPTQTQTTRRGQKFLTREVQLFPGYLFIRLDPRSSDPRAVNGTLGVARLVSFGDRPAPVPARLVEELIARCDSQGHLQPPPEIAPGDRVRLASGPFAEFVSTVEAITPDRRVWILLDILGRPTRVAVPERELRRA